MADTQYVAPLIALPFLASMAATASEASTATPERQKEALDVVAAVIEGKQWPEDADRYFAKTAVYVGPTRDPWDMAKFKASLEAAGCGKSSSFWPQERVLGGVSPEFAKGLRKKGHPKGPGLSFYCASRTVIAGHSMMTFRFEGDKIAEVEQAYYVPVPPPPPAPPRDPATDAEMRSRYALSTVRNHFGVIARRDAAELEALFLETAAIPVSGPGGSGVLHDFYRDHVAPEDGRMVKLTGCRTAPDFPKTERVDCTLVIDLPAANGVAARFTYQLGYLLEGRKVERVIVAPAQPAQVSN